MSAAWDLFSPGVSEHLNNGKSRLRFPLVSVAVSLVLPRHFLLGIRMRAANSANDETRDACLQAAARYLTYLLQNVVRVDPQLCKRKTQARHTAEATRGRTAPTSAPSNHTHRRHR